MAVIVNGDGILTGISSLATALTDLTSGRGTVTGVATVGTLQLGTGVSISSPRSQNAAIFTNNTEFLTVDDAGRVGVGTISPNTDAHPQNVGKINVGFITARSVAGNIDGSTLVVAGISTFVGNVNLGGGNIVLGDSGGASDDRLTFGAGTDFSLYHTGSHSFIEHSGTGHLILGGVPNGNNVDIMKAGYSEYMARFKPDSSVDLYYDANVRFQTTPSGADVTGTLNVSGISTFTGGLIHVTSATSPAIRLQDTNNANSDFKIYSPDGDNHLRIYHQNTSSDLVTLTSAGKLGVGVASPVSILHLHEAGSSGAPIIQFSNGDTGTTTGDGFAIGLADNESPFIYNRENTDLRIATNNTERLRITSAGIIQCGTSGTLKAEINNAVSGHQFISQCSDNNNGFEIYQQHGSTATRNTLAVYDNRGNSGAKQLSFAVVGNGNAKIQDGDLIIGTSGHGIDFSATGDGSGTDSSELFDDYEEGTWTPLIRNSSGTGTAGGSNYGYYTKVGNVVHAHATVHWTALSGGTTSALVVIAGLPYTTKNASNYRSTTLIGGQIVGVHNGNNDGMNIAIGCDANMSAVYVTAVDGSTTAAGNYTHYPTVLSTGTIYGFAFTYLT